MSRASATLLGLASGDPKLTWLQRSSALWPEIDPTRTPGWAGSTIALPEGPGDGFFPELRPGIVIDDECAMVLRGFRRILAETRPRYVTPTETTGEVSDYGEMLLRITHSDDPKAEIWLDIGDGVYSMGWPDGDWGWPDEASGLRMWQEFLLGSTAILRGLLTGRNAQTLSFRRRRLAGSVLEVRDEGGAATVRVDQPHRRRLMRPFRADQPEEQIQRTISFDASPPIADSPVRRT